MKDKQSRNVVIINDIHSDTIEQAIFILRNAGVPAVYGPGTRLLKEAQQIIGAYAKTVERASTGLNRKKRKAHAGRGKRGMYAAMAFCGFLTVAYGIYRLYMMLF